MRAVIMTIGDELLIGQVQNSNAAWLGEHLNVAGIDVVRTVTVGDDLDVLVSELGRALDDSDLVIATGGLGPTHDDVTRDAIAKLYGTDLEFRGDVFETIQRRFADRGRRMPESNRRQAHVPQGFAILANHAGTAPGLWYEDERGRILAVLPGVPHEMKRLFAEAVQPRLLGRTDLRVIEHRTLRTAGIGESALQERIGDVSALLTPTLRLAFLPDTAGVRLRLTAVGQSKEEVHEKLQQLATRLRGRIERYIYGEGDESLEEVVGRMLEERTLSIAVAESCTGGHVLNQLTNVPGSSSYLVGGVVAYSNHVKTSLLGVDAATLAQEGAVSEDVAVQMAVGARERLRADVGISTTGIAGPTGGTPEKPVGTVWVGYADAAGSEARLLRLVDERLLNKELTTTMLLDLVRRKLLSGGSLR